MKIIPKKSLGQNFLVDKNIICNIARLIDNKSELNLIEIGPGYGSLTSELIKKKPNKLVVIEKDEKLVNILKENFGSNIDIVNDDILNICFENYIIKNTVIIGNLPYNISTKILTNLIKFINKKNSIKYVIFMFQKEVADRIIAKENSKEYGRISILVNWKMNVKKLFDINPECFNPKPKIKSTLLFFEPKTKIFELKRSKTLEHITNIFFQQRRKIIKNSMKLLFSDYIYVSKYLGIDLNLRPQNLSVETYLKISDFYEKNYFNKSLT